MKLRWMELKPKGRVTSALTFAAVTIMAALALSAAMELALASAAHGAGAAPQASVYVVNSLGDASDAAPGDGVCAVAAGQCTLRAAIEEANAGATAAVVRFGVAPGSVIKLAKPLLVLQSVAIQGPTVGALQLDGQTLTHHLDIGQSGLGQALAVSVTHLSLVNGVSSLDGGSVSIHYTGQPLDVAFDRVVFDGNLADGMGGALAIDRANVRVLDSLFQSNGAWSGGAIANLGGSLRFIRSTLALNAASNDGGGIYNRDSVDAPRSHGVMTVTVSTLTDNFAGVYGGGLANESVDGFGAATWVQGSTIVRNGVGNANPGLAGGGAYNGDFSTLVLNNSILAANSHTGGGPAGWDDCRSDSGSAVLPLAVAAAPDSFLTGGDNLLSTGPAGGCIPSPGDIQYDPARIFTAVLHDQLRSYDGSQPMFALRPGSPAIDRTSAGSLLCGSALTVDQRGAPKPLGPACDIGAYEAALPGIQVARTVSLSPNACTRATEVELATGAFVYSCATVLNQGNVAFTRTVLADPASDRTFTLSRLLQPGESITLTARDLPGLSSRPANGDLQVTITGKGDSQWSAPPGIPDQASAGSTARVRSLDVTMSVTAQPFGFGAIRTVTPTVSYHEDGARVPDRLVQLIVSGGTSLRLPAERTNADGQVTFTYLSLSPLTPASGAVGGNGARQSLSQSPDAVAATDFLQLWVDLNGDGVRDPFEPMTAAGLPTAISLASFTAQATAGREVLLEWRTASETDVAGFNLYRASEAEGPYIKVNAQLIPSQGAGLGSAYQYTDHPAGAGAYHYKLEEVSVGGQTLLHGPLTVMVSGAAAGPYRVLAPMLGK